MEINTATAVTGDTGPLTRIVERYCALIEARATASGATEADWAPLAELVAVDGFKRVGAYMEEMSWPEYVRFMTQWAGATRFEMTVFRITEIANTVFQEIEERHYKGDDFIRKNVLAVYTFDETSRIRHLDIYEQAKDSGRWIVEAAHAAAEASS
jgi:hypothetical protein